jgi:hypothetical protein
MRQSGKTTYGLRHLEKRFGVFMPGPGFMEINLIIRIQGTDVVRAGALSEINTLTPFVHSKRIAYLIFSVMPVRKRKR